MVQATFLFDIICTWMIVRKSFLNYSLCTQNENIFEDKQGRDDLITEIFPYIRKKNHITTQYEKLNLL